MPCQEAQNATIWLWGCSTRPSRPAHGTRAAGRSRRTTSCACAPAPATTPSWSSRNRCPSALRGGPTLVAEVLSPSTTDTDRREKALAFAACPSLRQYILIDPDRRRIEVAVPGPAGMAWQSYGPGDVVTTPYVALDVDSFYDALEASATTLPGGRAFGGPVMNHASTIAARHGAVRLRR
ncbi:MAG: Uma2 family endonuclease [Actinomycetota bacterium]|nr:Uma2 family endonuclease [Actinomycetota bacterium]